MRLALLFTLAVPLAAADVEIKGHLLDAACAFGEARTAALATHHSKACLQMADCERSGYGVLTPDMKFIRFDKAGDEQAKKFLAPLKKTTDIRIAVTGTVTGDRITVQKIEL